MKQETITSSLWIGGRVAIDSKLSTKGWTQQDVNNLLYVIAMVDSRYIGSTGSLWIRLNDFFENIVYWKRFRDNAIEDYDITLPKKPFNPFNIIKVRWEEMEVDILE